MINTTTQTPDIGPERTSTQLDPEGKLKAEGSTKSLVRRLIAGSKSGGLVLFPGTDMLAQVGSAALLEPSKASLYVMNCPDVAGKTGEESGVSLLITRLDGKSHGLMMITDVVLN